jgi:N-acylneuraminate cytidylyltransferase/CMP-N,N'-diacetyllegionaminic acid synthase
MTRNIIAIIPARGGSKGLPNKNILPLQGKPMIAYTIEEARKSKYIQAVVVSTDYPDIAEIARQYGADVPFLRPAELATDASKSIDVYFYTIARLREQGMAIDDFIVLQPTSPLRTVEHIDAAIELYYAKAAYSVISMTGAKPYVWSHAVHADGRVEKIFDANETDNRQVHSKTYMPNGSIYIFNHDKLLASQQYYTADTYAYLMPGIASVDIDDQDDFFLADLILGARQK